MCRLLLSLLFCLAVAQPVAAQVAYDNSAGTGGGFVGTLTLTSFAVGAGSNRALVCGISWTTNTGITVSTLTFNTSENFASVAAAGSSGNRQVQFYRLIAPSNTSANIVLTMSDTLSASLALACVSYSGVDQTTPVTDFVSAGGTSTTADPGTVTNVTANDFVQDIHGSGAVTTTMTADGSRTEFYNAAPGDTHGASRKDGVDGGDMTWTLNPSSGWLAGAVRIQAVASAATASRMMLLGCCEW